MKKIILTIAISLISLISISQEVDIKKENENKYTFKFEMGIEDSESITKSIKDENIEVKKVQIKENNFIIVFKNNTSQERIDKILLYCSTKFNYTSFKIVE